MKAVYPIIMNQGKDYIVVFIPDFNINTQGVDYADAIGMARDAIGLMGIDMEKDKKIIPQPSSPSSIVKEQESDIITLVDVDFAEYKRKNDLRTVRRNVSLPSWLDMAAKEAKINVSAILTKALKKELNITDRIPIRDSRMEKRRTSK